MLGKIPVLIKSGQKDLYMNRCFLVLVQYCAWKCIPTAISVGVDISEVSLNQTLLTFLLFVIQNWMTELNLEISVRGYFALIQKNSATHLHGTICLYHRSIERVRSSL